jgi:hypothetical protein
MRDYVMLLDAMKVGTLFLEKFSKLFHSYFDYTFVQSNVLNVAVKLASVFFS